MSDTVSSRFAMTSSNFVLNPKVHFDFYAPRTGVDVPQIVESLRIDLVTDLPPKRLFWGLYGGGKTHTLYTVSDQLGTMQNVCRAYVECPNVGRRSTFLHLYHDGIMVTLGQDFVLGLLEKLIDRLGMVRREQLVESLRPYAGSEDIAKAVASLLGADASKKLALWRFLSGVTVGRQELATLEQTEDLTSAEPTRLVDVIIMLGRILWEVNEERLVLILDELDRLEPVSEETGSTFSNAFRRMVDPNQKDIAILMACSAGNLQQLPHVFGGQYGPVLGRIGPAGQLHIPSLDFQDVDRFIVNLIGYLRDANADVDELIREAQEAGITETLERDFFPFSKESLESLKGTLPELMTPRYIMQSMTHAIGRAHLMNRLAVTSEVIAP